MPCGCCGHGFCFGHLMFILEKIAAFCAMSAIISCIIVTVIVSIGLGVGIGYNYCFVDMKTSKISAIESFKNSDNPPKLPKIPNAFPFSGESSNETEITTQNSNTFILYTTSNEILTFPSIPNIPNIPNIPDTSEADVSSYSPGNISHSPKSSQGTITSNLGGSELTLDVSGNPIDLESASQDTSTIPSGLGPIPSFPAISVSIPDMSDSPSGPWGSLPGMVNVPSNQEPNPSNTGDPGSIHDESRIPGYQETTSIVPEDQETSPNPEDQKTGHDFDTDQEPITATAQGRKYYSILPSRQEYITNIPQSPNFPGSFRKIPINSNKAILPVSGPQSGGRKRLEGHEAGRVTNQRRKQFEAIRKGVKENAYEIDKSFNAYELEYEDVKDNAKHVQTESRKTYSRRKPARGRKQKKVTKNTTFMPTIVIPLKKYANMSPLISKILAQNKNVTLQFIAL